MTSQKRSILGCFTEILKRNDDKGDSCIPDVSHQNQNSGKCLLATLAVFDVFPGQPLYYVTNEK